MPVRLYPQMRDIGTTGVAGPSSRPGDRRGRLARTSPVGSPPLKDLRGLHGPIPRLVG
jgi:hypothetical protein